MVVGGRQDRKEEDMVSVHILGRREKRKKDAKEEKMNGGA